MYRKIENFFNTSSLVLTYFISLHSYPNIKYQNFRFVHSIDEYDHLDYNSAGSSFKPHYHRMNDMLNITKEEHEVKESNITSNNLDAPGLSLLESKSTNSSETSNTSSHI